jgi:hypothetical protein
LKKIEPFVFASRFLLICQLAAMRQSKAIFPAQPFAAPVKPPNGKLRVLSDFDPIEFLPHKPS